MKNIRLWKTNKGPALLLMVLMVLLVMGLAACGGAGAESGSGSQTQAFSFIYMGDPQADPETGDYQAWGDLLKMAIADEAQPALILLGGDLVNDGDDQAEWDDFFKAGGDIIKDFPIYPAMGNHDNIKLFKQQFKLPQNGPKGKEGHFYSFDYGDAFFLVMDSNLMGAANKEDIEWLRKSLSESKQKFRIVMFHHPAYPGLSNPKDEMRANIIKENFVPIFEEYGVDLVLNGHQHIYMRTYPMKEDRIMPEGIVYLIGVAGGKHYSAVKKDYAAFVHEHDPVYSIITVGGDTISIRTQNRAGDLLDKYEIEKNIGKIHLGEDQENLTIEVAEEGWEGKEYTLKELGQIPYIGYLSVYSTVNNWPSPILYSARGFKIKDILKEAGLYEEAVTISLISSDGYRVSLLKDQLFEADRYSYPAIMEGVSDGSALVEPIIAYAYQEGTSNLQEVKSKKPCLIFGQTYIDEHTNPAFVEDVVRIEVSKMAAETWEMPDVFPPPGPIAKGESAKLQHKYFGLVKLHYTLDGSEPTELSPMYNPSTYQPELNLPIRIDQNTTIKVKAIGYGKKDSPVATFEFTAIE